MDVNEFLARAAEKCGFNRERYSQKNMPADVENVVVLMFFGDVRSELLISNLFFERYLDSLTVFLITNLSRRNHEVKYIIRLGKRSRNI